MTYLYNKIKSKKFGRCRNIIPDTYLRCCLAMRVVRSNSTCRKILNNPCPNNAAMPYQTPLAGTRIITQLLGLRHIQNGMRSSARTPFEKLPEFPDIREYSIWVCIPFLAVDLIPNEPENALSSNPETPRL